MLRFLRGSVGLGRMGGLSEGLCEFRCGFPRLFFENGAEVGRRGVADPPSQFVHVERGVEQELFGGFHPQGFQMLREAFSGFLMEKFPKMRRANSGMVCDGFGVERFL